jgi:SAM-dependent methyltransferase
MKQSFPPPATETEVEELNDRLAREHPIDEYYDRAPRVVRFVEARRLAVIRELAALPPGGRLLEVGSGGGHVLRLFPQGRLTAVDVSGVYLETARRNLAGYDVEYCKGELDRLGLPEASFDCVICSEVLEHVTDPRRLLRAIAPLLSPGGRAVITVPVDPLIDALKVVVRRTPIRRALGGRINWGGELYHIHRWWPREIRMLLEETFVVEVERAVPFVLLPLRVCFLCRHRPNLAANPGSMA